MPAGRSGWLVAEAGLLAVAFLGGLITAISPCIVPVLPAVVAGGSAGTKRARPFLQRAVPGYTSALQNEVEGGSSIASQLQKLSGEHANSYAKKQAEALAAKGSANAKKSSSLKTVPLPHLGPAANFTGIVAWLNTPGDRPLSLAQLRGKVVLVDFWTYSCINCQRSLPHVEAWYNAYRNDGFVVVHAVLGRVVSDGRAGHQLRARGASL